MVSLILDRAGLLFCDLGAEQMADDTRRLVPALDAGRHHLVIGRPHPVELGGRINSRTSVRSITKLAVIAVAIGDWRVPEPKRLQGSGLLQSTRDHGAAPGCSG
jgi:hypothetical protein